MVEQCDTDNGDIGDSIFAQACVLARKVGLHQTYFHNDNHSGLATWELEERHRVYQSLYIRDRLSTTASGTSLWLPGLVASNRKPSLYSTHLELAAIQDELYHGLGTAGDNTSERRATATRISRKLRAWQDTYGIPFSTPPSNLRDTVLHLGVLGARMYINMESENHGDGSILDDARLSCLLLLVCSPDCSREYRNQIHALLGQSQEPKGRCTTWSEQSSASSSSSASPMSFPTHAQTPSPPFGGPQPTNNNTARSSLLIYRVAKVFPITAIFILARHILGLPPCSGTYPAEVAASDIQLLESLYFLFQTTRPFSQKEGHSNNTQGYTLIHILERLLKIIRTIKNQDHIQTTHPDSLPPEDHFEQAPLSSTYPVFHDGDLITEIDKADVWYSKDATSPAIDMSFSSLQSTWPTPQDSIGACSTPSLATCGTLYMPSIGPSTPVDLSHFFATPGPIELGVWDRAGMGPDVHHQVQPRKRQRIDDGMGR